MHHIGEPLDLDSIDFPALLDGGDPASAFGLLACSPDTEYESLLARLAKTAPFPIVGGTISASPFDTIDNPFMESLSAVAKKGMRHAISLSDPIDQTRAGEQMERLYADCLRRLGCAPAMFLLFTPIFPNLFVDSFLNELYRLAGSVPVFGGMMSDDFHSDRSAVFADGAPHRDRVLLIGLGGEIRPVFGIGRKITVLSDYSPAITEARGNVILRVDDVPFTEYMAKLGFGPDALSDFPITVRLRQPDAAPDALPDVHALVAMDPASGSGVLDALVKPDSIISLGFLSKQDIVDSTAMCLDELERGMRREEADGYAFSTVMAVSCIARYYTMFGQGNVEAEMLAGRLPRELERFGFFGFTEFCPAPGADGVTVNGRHGQTLGMCAF